MSYVTKFLRLTTYIYITTVSNTTSKQQLPVKQHRF